MDLLHNSRKRQEEEKQMAKEKELQHKQEEYYDTLAQAAEMAKREKDEAEYNDRTCIVVIDVHDISIGVIVDEVSEVLNIEDEDIVPPPNLGGNGRKYIKAVGKTIEHVILIIDCEQLLDKEEVEELAVSS